MKTISLIFSLFLISSVTNAVLQAADYTEETTETFDASSIHTVEFQTFSGNINVQGEDRMDISVTKLITVRNTREANVPTYLEKVEQTLERDDGTFRLLFENEESSSIISKIIGTDHSISISLDVRIPKNIVSELQTSGGNIRVENVSANVIARTSGGNLNFNNIEGSIIARTSGGHINVNNVSSDAELKTSGGNLTLKNLHGNILAKTSGGNIYAQLLTPITRDSSLRTSGGNIKVELSEESSFHLNAATSGGKIRSDLKIESNDSKSKQSLEGNVNGGGPDLVLKTSGGNISIEIL